MNSMNSKAIAILFLGFNQFATSMSKAIQLAYLSLGIYDDKISCNNLFPL